MSSLADNLLNAHASNTAEHSQPVKAKKVVDLKNLPQLNNSSSNSQAAVPSKKAAPKIASTGVANITVSLVVPEPDQARIAAEQVMQDHKVQIAIAKSASPKHATFMIKGAHADIDAAKKQLERSLQPKITETIELPASSRSALIGSRGANLRQIEQKNHVQLELQRPQGSSTWTLEMFNVVISGSDSQVNAAKKHIFEFVDQNKQVTTERRFPAEFPDIAELVFGTKKSSLQGSVGEVTKKMEEIDAKIAEIERTYTREVVKTEGIPVKSDLLLAEPLRALISTPTNSEVTVYAPSHQLRNAVKQLKQHLQSQATQSLDISRAHGGDVAHARVLSRYFSAINLAKELSDTFGVQVSLKECVFTISGMKENVQQARKDLVKRVNELSPATLGVVRGMRYSLVRETALEFIEKQSALLGNVKAIIGPSDEMYLVYFDNGDDFAPSDEQIRDSVAAAYKQVSFLTELANNLARKVVPLPAASVAFVLNPLGTEAKALRKSLNVGIEKKDNSNGQSDDESGVVITGSKENVDEAVEALPQLVQLSRNHFLKSSYVEDFVVDQELVKQIVGRRGAQIQQFRNEFDVKMDVNNQGKVTVQGVETDVRNCIKAVQEFQRRLRDESQEELAIPNEFHAKLIGPKGKYVNRLRDKYQCVIRFPGEQAPDSDIIYIRGPSKGVNAVKREFTDLVEYEKLQNYQETIKLPASVIPRVVGRGGLVVNSIKADTGVQIDIGNASSSNADADVDVKVTGEKKKVKDAVSRVKDAASAIIDFTEILLPVDQQYWRRLQFERQQVLEKAGVTEENNNRLLNVPNQSAPKDACVKIQGPSEIARKIESAVKEFVQALELKSKVKSELKVPENRLRRVAGSMGAVRRETEATYNVIVDIPASSTTDSTKIASVIVSGETQKGVDEAIAHLRSIAMPESLSVKTVGTSWGSIRTIVQDKFGVRCQIKGTSKLPAAPDASAEIKLISVKPDVTIEIEAETKEKCTQAADFIKEKTPTTLAYVYIPSEKLGQVIGPGGKNIRATRQKTKCSIDVSADGPATLLGNKDSVEAAISALTI